MRQLLAFGLLAAAWSFSGLSTSAEELVAGVPAERPAMGQIVTVELIGAHHEYQLAKLRMHEYRFVTLPQQRRQHNDQIRLAKVEIGVLHRRLRDYRPFLRVGEYSPVRTAAEEHYLSLVAAEQRLRQLTDERVALFRLSRQHSQIHQLEVLQAATRLALARKAVGRP